MIFYKCDKKKCKGCDSPVKDSGLCNRTSDIKNAASFEEINGDYWEREPEPIIIKAPIDDGPPVILALISVICGFIAGCLFMGIFF